jgi:hypothetical protein
MLIAIAGLAGSGKDTTADFLVRNHGFVKVAFADPMKRFCKEVFGFTAAQLWGPSELRNAPDKRLPRDKHAWGSDPKDGIYTCRCCGATCLRGALPSSDPCYLTPRYALQTLGTEWGRDCYPSIWAEALIYTYKALRAGGLSYTSAYGLDPALGRPKGVVVPDLRFGNETDVLKKAGAKLIRVIRPGAGLAGVSGQHVSEIGQSGIPDSVFDAIILNDKSIDALSERLAILIEEWGGS